MARVLVPLAQGCEELEAVTITDLLTRGGIEVVTAGLDDRPVKASRGMTLLPSTTIDQVLDDAFDMIVLPGGQPGANNLNGDTRIHQLLKRLKAEGRFTAAICAAPKILADAGLLDGRRATSYPGALDVAEFPQVDVQLERVVRDDKVITSRGPGTAMDFALELVELLAGREKRDEVEKGLVR
jgi:4-methyl-5(b-hydroxyethyl)-thiazole monophosphate biosynthesis